MIPATVIFHLCMAIWMQSYFNAPSAAEWFSNSSKTSHPIGSQGTLGIDSLGNNSGTGYYDSYASNYNYYYSYGDYLDYSYNFSASPYFDSYFSYGSGNSANTANSANSAYNSTYPDYNGNSYGNFSGNSSGNLYNYTAGSYPNYPVGSSNDSSSSAYQDSGITNLDNLDNIFSVMGGAAYGTYGSDSSNYVYGAYEDAALAGVDNKTLASLAVPFAAVYDSPTFKRLGQQNAVLLEVYLGIVLLGLVRGKPFPLLLQSECLS